MLKFTEEEREVAAGLYIRVSSRRQAEEGVSLDKQEEDLRAYIDFLKRSQKAHIVDVYREEGYSARTGSIKKRPEFKRMLLDAEEGKINTLIVYKLDRFCRSTKDLWDTLEVLDKYGIEFESMQDKIDSRTANGRLIINILSSLAQHESEQISERTIGAMEFVAKQGRSNGGRTIGYERNDEGILIPIPKEVKLVKKIFSKCKELGSAGKVLSYLNANGYTMPNYTNKKGEIKGGGPFNKMTLIKLLENKKYIGKIQHNENIYDGQHEPIIDYDLFTEVGEILESNRISRYGARESHRIYLLKGIFFCGKCGHHLTPKGSGGKGTPYPYYVCTTKNHQKMNCDTKSIPAEAVENLIINIVKEIEVNKTEMDKIASKANEHIEKHFKDLSKDHQKIQNRLKKVNLELRNLVDLLKNEGQSAFSSVKDEMQKLETEKTKLTERERNVRFTKNDIEKQMLSAEVQLSSLDQFKTIIENPETTRKDLAQIIPLFIHKIEWHQDEKDPSTGTVHTTFNQHFSPIFDEKTKSFTDRHKRVNHVAPKCKGKLPGLDSNQ